MVPNAGLLLASQIQSSVVFSAAPWAAMYCVDTNTRTVDILGVSFIAVWLVFAFFNRIVNVCGEEQKIPERSWIFERLVHHLKLQPKDRAGGWRTNLEVLTEATKKLTRRGVADRLLFDIHILIFLIKDMVNSLAWEIMWLSFAYVYGLTRTITIWTGCGQPTDLGSCWGNVLQMGLGQIVPLVLLILPAFAFLESFSEFQCASIQTNCYSY